MPISYDPKLDAEFFSENDLVRDLRFMNPNAGAKAVEGAPAQTAHGLAQAFLRQHGPLFGITENALASMSSKAGRTLGEGGSELRYLEDKVMFDTVTVAFDQVFRDVPVWRTGVSVDVVPTKQAVIHATSQYDPAVKIKMPSKKAIKFAEDIKRDELARIIALDESEWAQKSSITDLVINDRRLFIYKYRSEGANRHQAAAAYFPFKNPRLEEGSYHVVVQVLFTAKNKKGPDFNFLVLIEVETQAVLYIEALFDSATAMVFETDPMTQAWGTDPTMSNAVLDPFRITVTLLGLTAPAIGIPWELNGEYCALSDFAGGTDAAPTEVSGSFAYNSRTLDFGAANAYWQNDRFFRLVQSLGFSLTTYFDGTTFPIAVDHYIGDYVNAFCYGDALGDGIGNTQYALAETSNIVDRMSIAADWRLVLHELGGHGILYDHVSSPNFGFAHSAGDSFACILNDPRTSAVGADRFITFPFGFFEFPNFGDRRHDRTPAAGWAWGGTEDAGGYFSEQILATTHFRIYRSLGGDSGDVARRDFAARTTAYLMLRAIGSLTTTTNPATAEPYASALIAADAGDWTSEGLAGGAYGKVIRWAFEKQGLYQPAGAPTPVATEGAAPDVDVFINDGRNGEYLFQPVHWNNQKVWNRVMADGGTTHQDPIVMRDNFAYVEISNRGTQPATNVRVRGFHCNPGAGLVWPDDWQPMTTADLTSPDLAPGASALVGPFTWVPSQIGHECMLMVVDATGDPSNIDLFSGGTDSIGEWRLVPHDNNIAQRNVTPVAAAAGATFAVYLRELEFIVKNPFPGPGPVEIVIEVPSFLQKREWKIRANIGGGRKFKLEPGERRVMWLEARGGDFKAKDIPRKPEERTIQVHVKIHGMTVGGMTFVLDPEWDGTHKGDRPKPKYKA